MSTITGYGAAHISTNKGPIYIPAIYVSEDVTNGYDVSFGDAWGSLQQTLFCCYNGGVILTEFNADHFFAKSDQGYLLVRASDSYGEYFFFPNSSNYVTQLGVVIFGANGSKRLCMMFENIGHPGTTPDVSISEYNTGSDFGSYIVTRYYTGVNSSSSAGHLEGYILQDIEEGGPILYHWRSWERLAGNSGQFAINLPIIKPDIADQITPSDNQFLHTDDFTSLSNEASVWSTYLNALLGVEYTIAWSGNNRATLTVTNDPNEPRDKIFTFKFYLGAAGAPFATLVDDVRVGGTDPEFICSNYLLSIMYDQTNGVAAPVLLGYYAANTSYDYLSDAYTAWSQTTMENMYTWLQASANAPSGSGPYDTGTTDTGGTPTGGGHQDPMPNVNVPTLSGAASGMFTIYCPDDTELAQIATFLWSDNVLDNFKKYFNNFSDNIIALYVLPYKAANMPTKAFTVGKMTATVPAAVDYITTRFVSVEMGELTVGTRWDSYLDFEPYTKFNIYLPGIGVQALSADDIICPPNDDESLPIAKGSKLSLTYVLDLMTGNVAAYVKINGQIRYQFTGKVGYSIPLTGANYNSMVQGYVMATAGLIGTIASGGTAAPFAASAGAAGIINAMKPDVYRGGNLSGDSSALCLQYPYLIRRRPNKPYLKEQEIYTGFPSYMSGLLSEFSGFTQVIDAHVEGISCTEAERAEILQLLKSGVIL